LWEWAPIEANQEARRRDWGGNFTLEEKQMGIHNVATGLSRQLAEEEEENEDEFESEGAPDEEMEIVGVASRMPAGPGVEPRAGTAGRTVPGLAKAPSTALPLDEVFRYMVTGTKPKSGHA
jgi:mediator of RNA polymerase II transcription subunit 8, fungi type